MSLKGKAFSLTPNFQLRSQGLRQGNIALQVLFNGNPVLWLSIPSCLLNETGLFLKQIADKAWRQRESAL
ncbi:hypothetical protein B5X24_HaOG203065 [Helicoverpa armigera]|uniref:Uncharacterized protein n=1 Tax=Helicoverpa armigera TaxID=29058 RepID=A0A2W1BRN4_HELAM|nr:hypothetical protein B5X24_HaOG203065 [Helicoverpa armigera]